MRSVAIVFAIYVVMVVGGLAYAITLGLLGH